MAKMELMAPKVPRVPQELEYLQLARREEDDTNFADGDEVKPIAFVRTNQENHPPGSPVTLRSKTLVSGGTFDRVFEVLEHSVYALNVEVTLQDVDTEPAAFMSLAFEDVDCSTGEVGSLSARANHQLVFTPCSNWNNTTLECIFLEGPGLLHTMSMCRIIDLAPGWYAPVLGEASDWSGNDIEVNFALAKLTRLRKLLSIDSALF